MRKFFPGLLAAVSIVLFSGVLFAADYRIGGNWVTDGEGFIEKGVVRVELKDSGWLRFESTMSGDSELLTGYEMYGKLEASSFSVGVWEDRAQDTYDIPIVIPPDFNPSMSDPFRFPSITASNLTYTLELTSVTSGTLHVHGYVDIDVVGTCEVNMHNDIWKEGTERPASEASDSGSGCSAGAGGTLFLIAAAIAAIFKKTDRRRQG